MKISIISSILIIAMLFESCAITSSNNTKKSDNHYKAEIPDVGYIMLPKDISVIEKDGVIYLHSTQNESSSPIMAGIYSDTHYGETLSSLLGKDTLFIKTLSSETLSNSAIIGTQQYLIDSQLTNIHFFDLYSSNKKICFFDLSGTVEYDVIISIAKSFVMS